MFSCSQFQPVQGETEAEANHLDHPSGWGGGENIEVSFLQGWIWTLGSRAQQDHPELITHILCVEQLFHPPGESLEEVAAPAGVPYCILSVLFLSLDLVWTLALGK